MTEINLLRTIPKIKRSIGLRSMAKTINHINISREYGQMYFDGPREYGYGGYKYDGRWKSVAKDIVKHFNLKKRDKVLDVGCAKGFLVKDLLSLGVEAYGIDISKYAISNCEPEVADRLILGSAHKLPFEKNSFSAVLSINTIHNLDRDNCILALKEMERVAPGKGFVQVDSYYTEEQKKIFESWVLTAKYHNYPNEWIKLFKKANYTGDWYWTIIE